MSEPAFETLQLERRGQTALVRLNRPQAGNALNRQMSLDFFNLARHCDADPDIRAVVLTGNGKLFSGGGDLRELAAAESRSAHFGEMTAYFHAAMARFARMDAVLIGAVNGAAGGAGIAMVCACDLVVSAESARYVLAYTRAGLSPDGSSTYYLPRLIGLRCALELALTNRTLSAQEALDWGLVNRVVPDDQLLNEALAWAEQLAAGPTRAFGETKRLLHGSWTTPMETQLEMESQAIARMVESADGREGVAAFLEKRSPTFGGR